MQKFIASTGMMALAANAEYMALKTFYDGRAQDLHIKSHMGAQHEVAYDGYELKMPANSMVVLQEKAWDGPDYAFKPLIRGGSIRYWTYL